jgi:carboxypeptidase C (cathepsin A)
MLKTIVLVLSLLAGASVGYAQEEGKPAPSGGGISLKPEPQSTVHSVTVGGKVLTYEAKAEMLPLLSGEGSVTANIFYVSYTARPHGGTAEPPERPVTFVFNGGPGAASAYLHLGGLGPRILATGEDGTFLPAPPRLIDNPDSWLDMTDLVFVDPAGTGYSRAAKGHKEEDFWGVNEDAASLGSFVRLYLAQTGRTASPVFLTGESYGGFRVALLARTLQEDVGITPSGIVLISPALEFMLVQPDEFDLLHWAIELPSMAAVRLISQGATGRQLEQQLAEVERYATGDYLAALASGLESGGRQASSRVAEITGLPADLVERNFARIQTGLFAREFARARGLVLSLYDASVEGPDLSPGTTRSAGVDPVFDRSVPALTAAFVDYVSSELNFRTDVSYRLLNRDASRHWNYGSSRQGYAGVMNDLQRARALNPSLAVVIVNGYTDLITPYLATRYLVNQLPTLKGVKPIRAEVLPGGHMMYFRNDGRAALKQVASEIYRRTG